VVKSDRDQVSFKINGQSMTLSVGDVLGAVEGVEPEPVREHAVEVGGIWYPAKQPFALATGLDKLDFTTNQARRQLLRLGFSLTRLSESG
jgi:ADP-ribosylglycohydrolase